MSAESIYRRFMTRFAGNLRKQCDELKTIGKALHVAKTYGSDIDMSFMIEGQYFQVSIPGGTAESTELLETLSNFFVAYGHHLSFAAEIAARSGDGGGEIKGSQIAPEGP